MAASSDTDVYLICQHASFAGISRPLRRDICASAGDDASIHASKLCRLICTCNFDYQVLCSSIKWLYCRNEGLDVHNCSDTPCSMSAKTTFARLVWALMNQTNLGLLRRNHQQCWNVARKCIQLCEVCLRQGLPIANLGDLLHSLQFGGRNHCFSCSSQGLPQHVVCHAYM